MKEIRIFFGFLSAETSIRMSRVFKIMVLNRVIYAELSKKMKILGIECQRISSVGHSTE